MHKSAWCECTSARVEVRTVGLWLFYGKTENNAKAFRFFKFLMVFDCKLLNTQISHTYAKIWVNFSQSHFLRVLPSPRRSCTPQSDFERWTETWCGRCKAGFLCELSRHFLAVPSAVDQGYNVPESIVVVTWLVRSNWRRVLQLLDPRTYLS